MQFKNRWFAWYPRPQWCICDNGGKFKGAVFQRILLPNGIADAPTFIKNPQPSAICERMHQTVGSILCTLDHAHPPAIVQNVQDLVDTTVATTMHGTRAPVHQALQVSPRALLFHQDMFLGIPLLADKISIHAC
jgi:hypothetical protein